MSAERFEGLPVLVLPVQTIQCPGQVRCMGSLMQKAGQVTDVVRLVVEPTCTCCSLPINAIPPLVWPRWTLSLLFVTCCTRPAKSCSGRSRSQLLPGSVLNRGNRSLYGSIGKRGSRNSSLIPRAYGQIRNNKSSPKRRRC